METINAPKIIPIKVEKKKPTGTKELSTIASSLDAIHDGLLSFMDTVNRSEEKESQIADRLTDLKEVIEEQGVTEEVMEILEDLDNRIFEEKFYTEKGSGRAMVVRMTDDTKLKHLRAFAAEASKVASAKFKMSAGDYTPKAIVVAKMQQSIGIFQKVMKEYLGPQLGDQAVKDAMTDIVELWDEH